MFSAGAAKRPAGADWQDREPNWPVSVLSSAHSRAYRAQRQTMAICVGYFEGNDSRDTIGRFTVAGFVAPKARWRFFEDKWASALHGEALLNTRMRSGAFCGGGLSE